MNNKIAAIETIETTEAIKTIDKNSNKHNYKQQNKRS